MKKILCLISIMLLVPICAQAAVTLTAIQNRMFQLAASGWIPLTIAKCNGLNLNWRSQYEIIVMRDWLRVESGQSGSLALVFSNDVYELFLSKLENFRYGTVAVTSSHAAPTNCAVNGSDIDCDEPASGTLALFSWNAGTQLFADTEDTASCAAGTCTFSAPGSGTYVVGFTGNEFPSLFLTIP